MEKVPTTTKERPSEGSEDHNVEKYRGRVRIIRIEEKHHKGSSFESRKRFEIFCFDIADDYFDDHE
jgi:hypothetical protein